jgi:hypothetical protein
MCASGSRDNNAELGQSAVDFVLFSIFAYESVAFALEELHDEGLIVRFEEFVPIQKKGGDSRPVLQLATAFRQHRHENLQSDNKRKWYTPTLS